jgi:hypothetical protein
MKILPTREIQPDLARRGTLIGAATGLAVLAAEAKLHLLDRLFGRNAIDTDFNKRAAFFDCVIPQEPNSARELIENFCPSTSVKLFLRYQVFYPWLVEHDDVIPRLETLTRACAAYDPPKEWNRNRLLGLPIIAHAHALPLVAGSEHAATLSEFIAERARAARTDKPHRTILEMTWQTMTAVMVHSRLYWTTTQLSENLINEALALCREYVREEPGSLFAAGAAAWQFLYSALRAAEMRGDHDAVRIIGLGMNEVRSIRSAEVNWLLALDDIYLNRRSYASLLPQVSEALLNWRSIRKTDTDAALHMIAIRFRNAIRHWNSSNGRIDSQKYVDEGLEPTTQNRLMLVDQAKAIMQDAQIGAREVAATLDYLARKRLNLPSSATELRHFADVVSNELKKNTVNRPEREGLRQHNLPTRLPFGGLSEVHIFEDLSCQESVSGYLALLLSKESAGTIQKRIAVDAVRQASTQRKVDDKMTGDFISSDKQIASFVEEVNDNLLRDEPEDVRLRVRQALEEHSRKVFDRRTTVSFTASKAGDSIGGGSESQSDSEIRIPQPEEIPAAMPNSARRAVRIPPGTYTRDTLPPISPGAAKILRDIWRAVEQDSTAKEKVRGKESGRHRMSKKKATSVVSAEGDKEFFFPARKYRGPYNIVTHLRRKP